MIPVPLDLMAGLYTEATPDSLPAGASPLVINDDFNVGSVIPRPGKQSVYVFDGLFVEDAATVGVDVPTNPGDGAWQSPNNITHDTPGTYAAVTLSFSGASSPLGAFDKASAVAGITLGPTDVPLGPLTPALPNEVAIIIQSDTSLNTPVPGAWTSIFSGDVQECWLLNLVAAAIIDPTTHIFGMQAYAASLLLFFTSDGTAAMINHDHGDIDSSVSSVSVQFPNTVTPGNVLFTALIGRQPSPTGDQFSVADDSPVVYTPLSYSASGGAFGNTVAVWGSIAKTASKPIVTISGLNQTFDSAVFVIGELTDVTVPPPTGAESQILEATNFRFSIPSTESILGMQVIISGHQTSQDPGSFVTVSLVNPTATSPVFSAQLPASDGDVTLGTSTTNFGLDLEPALFNDPNFGINVQAFAAGVTTSFSIYAVKIKLYLSPNPAPDINYIKTFAETGGEVLTLVLGSDGVMYQENTETNPGVLDSVYDAIEPGSFAQSATEDDREFIAISNLQNGTDIPYTYSPPNFDRLSQVGPGAPPSAATNSSSNAIVSITQPTKKSDVANPGHLSGILWSAGPGSTVAGAVLTVYYVQVANQSVADPNLVVGVGIALSGVDTGGVENNFNGQPVDGNYVVTSVGQGVPPGASATRWYFTVTMPTSQSVNQANHIEAHAPTGFYQVTTATLTTSAQIANLEVDGTLQISGTGGSPTAGYDGSWTVATTPNAAQLQITSTQLSGNIATYGYNLITGTAPVVGQLVTVTQTLNGNGIFNISNVAISATSPGSFSVNLFGANVSSAPELGAGIIFGTIFTFDPMQIVGNKTGGSVVITGLIAQGIRKCCYSFLTRNGFLTQPSPICTFDITSGASAIVISNLLPGPDNVIARVIHLTAANGGNFYNIPESVTVDSNGTNQVNSSTWVNDNTSTSITLSFSDGVLLAADEIDIQGNNLFENIELGSCVALVPYAARIFAIGEQNKVVNFTNWSFDGGVAGGSGAATFPAGWTVDPVNGAGVSVAASPIFGSALVITNASGTTQAVYGMVTQSAFQDEFQVAIIQPSTTYSVRVTMATVAGGGAGNLVVDLFSPSRGIAQGTFTLALSATQSSMDIYTGTLLTTALAPVPNDLLLRIYGTALPNATQIIIDRAEVFPTEAPNLDQQITGSYVDNFEAFDRVTGVVGTSVQNQQPVRSAFVLFDSLYIVKTGSFISTIDNGTTEPSGWVTRTVSAAVGASGPYAVTTGIDEPNSGEEWAIICGRPGAFIFNGGEPIKLSEEIQSLWNQINWKFGHTLWVKNDIINRRILIGCPMKTPNTWIPAGLLEVDTQNPTTPNVILELNYKQLNTAAQLSDGAEVHRSYSGKLIASELVRKWSVWTIKAPCAAFVERPDGTAPIFLGNSDETAKIYQLVDGLLEDDGEAFEQIYTTYGFVPSDQGQGMQMGVTRFVFKYMTMLIDGSGEIVITVMPNTVNSGFSHVLLPNLTLPASSNGDVEIPVDEAGSRIYVQINAPDVGSGFILSRIVMVMRQDPWAPISGVNNV